MVIVLQHFVLLVNMINDIPGDLAEGVRRLES
jgi:hypothetical protein